jgi:transglutaminase-like putative cysteine protease
MGGNKHMYLVCESPLVEHYLCEQEVIDYSHPLVRETIRQLNSPETSEMDRIRKTFAFVRDTIPHSWDIQSPHITCKASEVLQYGTGICYAKAHLLAALLRAQGIPTGFCYQRLTRSASATGYVIHALNAVYLSSEARWIRLDARGNKPGVQAEFSTTQEKLAFSVQPELGEIDYPTIYVQPHPKTVNALREPADSLARCWHVLPDSL